MLNVSTHVELGLYAFVVLIAVFASYLVYRDAEYRETHLSMTLGVAVLLLAVIGFEAGGLAGLFFAGGLSMAGYALLRSDTDAEATADHRGEPAAESPTANADATGDIGTQVAVDSSAESDAEATVVGDERPMSLVRVEAASYAALRAMARAYDDIDETLSEEALRAELRLRAMLESDAEPPAEGPTDCACDGNCADCLDCACEPDADSDRYEST